MPITKIDGLEYGGKYHKYFWDKSVNPLASISNCLANCTCFVIGDVLHDGLPMPVSRIPNANQWHNYVANGWLLLDFKYDEVQVGDVLEWVDGCHVARVSKIDKGQVYVSGSFYTGEHGKSIYNGEYDKRTIFSTLEDVSDFMINNYPERFFHCWQLETENQWVKDSPRYILRQPMSIEPVARNEYVNQIQVLTNEQRIRDYDNNIIGIAKKGYYNVLSIAHSTKNEYEWYEVEENRYIAGIEDRVIYLPSDDDELAKLRKENKELKEDMKRIYEIIERWL